MFLVNYLNRNFTDDFFPLFESIYSFELAIQLASIILSVPVVNAIWTTKLFHRNIRLRLVFMPINATLAALTRVIIITHQVFGTTQKVYTFYLISASVFREYFKVYITGVALQLAFDRWIATIAWSWYESRAPTTIFVFIGQELFICSIGFSASYLLITDVITDKIIMLLYIVQLVIGVMSFLLVQRHNQNEMGVLKKGATIESYSVARSFQIRENLAIMKMLSKVAALAALLTIPCFILYVIYSEVPANMGLDTLRFLAIAMYDVWISISFLSIVVNLIRFEPKFRETFMSLPIIFKIRSSLGLLYAPERVKPETVHEGNVHFSMLTNDWDSSFESTISVTSV